MSAKTEINALAELESELRFTLTDIRGECCEASYEAVEKASRIIAELAKVIDCIHRAGTTLMYTPEERMTVISAVDNCREIAEKGEVNGN